MFITFEGSEGLGKSTHLKFVASQLAARHIPYIITREPGGTETGEEIRDILLKHRNELVDPMAELLLMFAARAQHITTVIKPALQANKWVLCDRFVDASYAYQGGGRGVPEADIEMLEKLVLKGFKPDLVLLFDASPAVGLQRVKGRELHPDRFEKEKIEFFERVRNAYLTRAKKNPKHYRILDASQRLETVQAALLTILDELHVHE